MKIGSAIFTGILLSLAFPPLPFYGLSFLAFLPFLNFVEKNVKSKKNNIFWTFYFTFFIYHLASNWWISSFQEQTDPFLMASGFAMDLFHPFFLMIPAYIYLRVRRRFSQNVSVALFPIIWAGWEYFHAMGEFSYPWLTVGNSQIYNLTWVQFIDITGVFGATFLIALVNAIVFKMYLNIKESKYIEKPALNIKWLILIILIFILPYIYGSMKINEYSDSNQSGKSTKIGIIQPNKFPWAKWESGSEDQVRFMMKISDSLSNQSDIDMFLWPETSILSLSYPGFNTAERLWFLQDWVDSNEIALTSGFIHRYFYKEDEPKQVTARPYGTKGKFYEHFNSAITVNPEHNPQTYHKMKLTPFAERIPRVEYLAFLMDYIKWGVGISSWGRGLDQHNLTIYANDDSLQFGNIICIESIYPEFCKNFANQGAEFLTLITNDSWYDGTPGPEQHWQIARIRAIENRRYIARCANSGVSGVIAPNGEELMRMEQYVPIGKTGQVKSISEKSFYTRNGDWLARPLMYIASVFWMFSFFLKRKKD
jgi:apolipoprotein N-acyltransferase